MTAGETGKRLPPWLRVSLSTGDRFIAVRNRIRSGNLHTVCESAACPNRNECWNAGTATFLLLGDRCTRSCRFCNIPTGVPQPVDHDEPERVALAVSAMGLSYAVVTSVTRDDLSDGGAAVFAATIRAIRRMTPDCRVEVLIPDFQGSATALNEVLAASPDVLNHNVETVPSLYRRVRPEAGYDRSLEVISQANKKGFVTKSGLMLGLGETLPEVRMVMEDLRKAGCDILTIGQYLRPRKDLLPVARFCHPDEFAALRQEGTAMGFRTVESAPLVRSSYHAGSALATAVPTPGSSSSGTN
jgi:lipoic acid synthetase